jgi:hypothetical protein
LDKSDSAAKPSLGPAVQTRANSRQSFVLTWRI